MPAKDPYELSSHDVKTPMQEGSSLPVRYPDVDIYETPESIVVIIDMPGVAPENLDIDVRDELLIVAGKVTPVEAGRNMVSEEYQAGDFYREFSLGSSVDYSSIDARLQNGELTLTLPKREPARPRKIKVRKE